MITLRKATLADSQQLFEWRNDPETVKACLTQRAVTPEEHATWLERTLRDGFKHLYIAEYDDGNSLKFTQVGTGRLEAVGPQQAVLHYTVAPAWRSMGTAGVILQALTAEAHQLGYRSIRVTARPENAASIKVLMNAGFEFSPVDLLTLTKELP